MTSEVISNQVFVGLPWKNVKKRYEHVCDRLRISYPVFFKIIGREADQEAKDLLETIKIAIQSSSYSIFDASDGNANVSLEYGYAEGIDAQKILYKSDRKNIRSGREHPMISDLAGKTRHTYKTEKSLMLLLRQFCNEHPYTKLFEKGIRRSFGRRSRGEKKMYRALALKVIHMLDDKEKVRRQEVVLELRGIGYSENEIDNAIRALHQHGLIVSAPGRYSELSIK